MAKGSKIKVKLLQGLAGINYTWPSGSIQEIEKDWAIRLVEAKQAELIKPISKPKSNKL